MKIKTIISLCALLLCLWAGASFAAGKDAPGAVYTMTNDATSNEVVIFSRDAKGMLTNVGSLPTGGIGSGLGLDPLGSQGSVILSQDKRWLLVVNAGSNEISVFRVREGGIELVDKVDSGGTFPSSLTSFNDLVYVLNSGAAPNISGFELSDTGQLTPIAGSTRLPGSGSFAEVGFDPHGMILVLTDKSDNEIFIYPVGNNGLPATSPVISPSNGKTPFGFIFDGREHLLVSEAGTNAVSTYNILSNGTLKVISPSVANGQTATCWITANARGDVYTASPRSHAISAYNLMVGNGEITLLNGTAGIADSPIDLAIALNGRFLYALDPGNGTIHMFQIKPKGGLVDLGAVAGGLSVFAQGLAAR
jgi:6-phosphogluconolactonase